MYNYTAILKLNSGSIEKNSCTDIKIEYNNLKINSAAKPIDWDANMDLRE